MEKDSRTGLEIAVVGLAGKFPGAQHIHEFWDNMKNGVESISHFSDEELIEAGIEPNLLRDPHYVKAKGIIDDIEYFDPAFFKYSGKEAAVMDPQIRLLHECAWAALEDAGYTPKTYEGKIGLYVGAASNLLWLGNSPIFDASGSSEQIALGTYAYKDSIATLIAYKLGLRGPSLTLYTACSTSLVAIHMACRGLLTGECSFALAGGVSASFPKKHGYLYQPGMILSSDGKCRPFDAQATGSVFGDGAGIVALKRLEDALADGDSIYAVIKGSAVNNDGANRAGYTAPGLEGQVEVIRLALEVAEVELDSIGYIETHGSGTDLGDTIEMEALNRVYANQPTGSIAIGAVKSNIGHLDTASGVAGFIKVVMALQQRCIPPTLHFQEPNPRIDFAHSPFYVNTQAKVWEAVGLPLRAAVSSFGLGGTNAHVILEEAPASVQTSASHADQLLVLSARTEEALSRMTSALALHLSAHPELTLSDVAYTLQLGRDAFAYRRTVVCKTTEEAVEELSTAPVVYAGDQKKRIVFMFSGQGGQYVHMAQDLYAAEHDFKAVLDQCFLVFKRLAGYDLQSILFPEAIVEESAREMLTRTSISQPVLFIVEYALAKLLLSRGVQPDAMIGYSFGEFVAACLAGVFSFEDALSLIMLRGKLMQEAAPGAMLSVPLSEEQITPLLHEQLSLAVVNGPSCIVSGTQEAIAAFEQEMKRRKLLCLRLKASHAAHSVLMEPLLPAFAEKMRRIPLHAPTIPYVSSITGRMILAQEATDPAYWIRHMRECVRFADGIKALAQESSVIFVEIGPGRELAVMVHRLLQDHDHQHVVDLLQPVQKTVSDRAYLLRRLGQLWSYGASLNYKTFYAGQVRKRIPLPSYAFDRQYYWLDTKKLRPSVGGSTVMQAVAEQRLDQSAWLSIPVWRQAPLYDLDGSALGSQRWLLLEDKLGLSALVAEELRALGAQVASIAHEDVTHSSMLLQRLQDTGEFPDRVIHFASLTHQHDPAALQQNGYFSLLRLVQIIQEINPPTTAHLEVVTQGIQEITGIEPLYATNALLAGLCKVIPQELPQLICRVHDVGEISSSEVQKKKLVQHLLREVASSPVEKLVAYRHNYRWLPTYQQLRLPEAPESSLLRKKGVYLITGGLGRIGLVLARYLAIEYQARLVLLARSSFPAREQWIAYSQRLDVPATVRSKIATLLECERAGAEILIVQADVADLQQMHATIADVERHFGPLNGVIHAAGLVGAETLAPIASLGVESSLRHFQAKLQGTLVLDTVLEGKKLDFCLLMSSIASLLGGLGHAAYAAANSFLDTFVYEHNRRSATPWLTVDWDGWDVEGLRSSNDAHKLAAIWADTAMSVDEGVQLFHRLLANYARLGSQTARIVHSTVDLQPRLDQWVNHLQARRSSPVGEHAYSKYPRPSLTTRYLAPRNEIEKKIVEQVEQILSIETVGVQDNFLELGGDSLKAITVLTKMNKEFQVSIPLKEFFDNLTIEWMARYIATQQTSWEGYAAIQPAAQKDYYVLSSAQKRMYILHQLNPSSTLYNNTIINTVSGLDMEKLIGVIQQLIERHESLRTSFHMLDEVPAQKIHAQVDFSLQTYQASDAIEIRDLIDQFVRPFDLAQAPLLRVGVIETPAQQQVFIIDIHHIISDLVSMDLFMRDFLTLYEGGSLLPLRLHYKDYAEWQSRQGQQENYRQHEAYWLARFQDEPPILNVPTDFLRPHVQSYEGDKIAFTFSQQETGRLRDFAQEHTVTLFLALFAAFNVLLQKLTGQNDLTVGVPVAGRGHGDLHEMMGLFVNTLAVRTLLTGQARFADFLLELKERVLLDFEHQDYPFEELVDKVVATRDLSRNPLFTIAFNMLHYQEVAAHGIQASKETYGTKLTSKFDMTWIAIETTDCLRLEVEYCTALFKAETIQRFIRYFYNLLLSLLDNDRQTVAAISVMSREEREQLLSGFHDTVADYPKDKTLHQLFEEQVARTPDQLAVIAQEEQLTYSELNIRSNQLARHLCKLGVGPEVCVGLCLKRSLDLMIGLLGILKAGGAYVPLDPTYPKERIAFMLSDSHAPLLLTQRKLLYGLPEFPGEIICLEDVIPRIPTMTSTDPETGGVEVVGTNTDQLAYVIYTSGSTGKPKGVMLSHRNVTNFFVGMDQRLGTQKPGVWLAVTSVSFDISVLELFWTLIRGFRVVIQVELNEANTTAETNAYPVATQICRYQVTHLQCTPSLMQILLFDEQMREALSQLDCVMLGGETFPPSLAAELFGLLHGRLFNMFGPTETTIWSSTFELRDLKRGISIGTPIANTTMYLLDSHLHPVPIGVTGELYIGGLGVARGYLQRPELTAERFIPHPFGGEPGARLYRSGDLARWLPGGELEYLGRRDQQVKIRGYRIEVEEIVHHLLAFPSVQDAVVVCLPQEDGIASLVAYLVAPHPLTVTELRMHLAARLPDYMLPAFYVQLPRLPLSANGKLERKALPHPQGNALPASQEPVPARSQREAVLLAIWQQTLGADTIGIHDQFFALGGDSIQALQISARLRKAGYHLPLRELFQAPTIAQLAPLLQPLQEEAQLALQSPVVGPVPLTPIQHWFFARHLPAAQHHHQAILLRSTQRLERESLRAIFTQIQAHHDALRLTFREVEGQVVQYNQGPEMPLALHVVDLRHQEQELAACCTLLLEETDLAHGPLMQVVLFHLAQEDRLLIAVHHLAVDAVSWRILLEDLSSLLAQQRGGQPLALPAKTSSYRDWARQLEHYASRAKVQQDVAYWREVCQPWSARVQPHDPQAPNREQETSTLSTQLSREETEALLSRAHVAFGTQVQDLLLGGLALTMEQITGQQDLVVALEGHGREPISPELDLSRTVGWFTTIYPLRLTLSKVEQEQELGRLVVEVKERLRRVPHKGLGYGVWRYLSGEAEREAFAVEPQILVNYLGQFEQENDERTGLSLAQESIGPLVSPLQERAAEWTVEAWVQEQHLHLTVSFNERRYKPEAMRAVLQTYEQQLRRLLTFCLAQTQPTLTPSDLTYKDFPIETLQTLLARFTQSKDAALQKRGNIEDIYRLSSMQEGLLFRWLYDNSSTSYFIRYSYRLHAVLEQHLVEQSLNELVRRHDILRTTFVYEGVDVPLQIVLKERHIDFRYADYSEQGLDAEGKARLAETCKTHDLTRGFNLGKDVLIRGELLKLDKTEYLFAWSIHHILMDGWCVGILIQEFFEIYKSLLRERPLQLPPAPPYQQYVQWLMEQDPVAAKTYWREYLQGYEMPAIIPRIQHDPQAYCEEKLGYTIEREKMTALRQQAALHQMTLNTILQTIWAIMLARYNVTNDVVFGMIVSGRPATISGIESMVGLFSNIVPVRFRIDPDATFYELARQAQGQIIESERYHYYQLAEIQAQSILKQQLFDHILSFENYPSLGELEHTIATPEMALRVSDVDVFDQTIYDLVLLITPGEQLTIAFQYNKNAISHELIEIFLHHLDSLLTQVVENMQTKVCDLKFIDESSEPDLLGNRALAVEAEFDF